MALMQLHHQYPDGTTDFRAQGSFDRNDDEFHQWVDGVKERHPLPEGCMWLGVFEGSRYFMAKADAGD